MRIRFLPSFPTRRSSDLQTWRSGGQSLGHLQEPEFRRPVHQRPAQSLNVWMPRAKLALDVRDLLAAAGDSLRPLLAFHSDLLEGSPVAVESRALSRVLLPANDDRSE